MGSPDAYLASTTLRAEPPTAHDSHPGREQPLGTQHLDAPQRTCLASCSLAQALAHFVSRRRDSISDGLRRVVPGDVASAPSPTLAGAGGGNELCFTSRIKGGSRQSGQRLTLLVHPRCHLPHEGRHEHLDVLRFLHVVRLSKCIVLLRYGFCAAASTASASSKNCASPVRIGPAGHRASTSALILLSSFIQLRSAPFAGSMGRIPSPQDGLVSSCTQLHGAATATLGYAPSETAGGSPVAT